MNTLDHQARLNDTQVQEYRHEGFIILEDPIFAPEKFQRLKDHFETQLSELAEGVRPETMDVPHFTDPALFEWIFADEVLDIVESLIGPDIALWSSHFISKPKGDGKRVPWHEDSAYWKGQLEPMEVVTLWLAIDPSNETNGGMRVVPRTHDNGFSEYEAVDPNQNVFPTEITRIERFDRLSVPINLEPNQASLHDGKLIHGSPANTSQLRRTGYTMRYMPSSVKFEGVGGLHQIYLARGRDLAGNTYADPTQSYPELARFRKTSGKKFH
jgi:Phytanoyl-CoA dioxygenase (PhyH)